MDKTLQEEINGKLLMLEEGDDAEGLVEALKAASDQARKNMLVMLVVLEAIQQLEGQSDGVIFIPDALREQFTSTIKV